MIKSLTPLAKQASVPSLDLKVAFGGKLKADTTVLYTINDLLVQKALSSPDVPFLAYPASPKGRDDYVHYTARDLDRFADEAARAYVEMGLPVKVRSFYDFFINVNLAMSINVSRQTIMKMRLSQYWHRLIWITLQPYLLSPESDTLFSSYRIVFLRWHIYLFFKVRDVTGLSVHKTLKSKLQQPRPNASSSLSLLYHNKPIIYRILRDPI